MRIAGGGCRRRQRVRRDPFGRAELTTTGAGRLAAAVAATWHGRGPERLDPLAAEVADRACNFVSWWRDADEGTKVCHPRWRCAGTPSRPGLRARARSERVGRRRPMPFGLAAGGEPSDLRRCLERERLLRRTSLFKPSVAALLLTTSVNRRTSSGGRPWSIAGTECTPSSPAMTVVNPRRALAADPPRLDVEDSRVEHARRFHADEAGRAGRPLSGRRRSQRGDRTRSASLRCWHGLGRSGVCRSARSSSSSTCVT